MMKFRQRIANTNPPNFDVLVEQRFLRKKYKDPITGEDFQLVFQTAAAGIQPGGLGSATPGKIAPIGGAPPPTTGGPSMGGAGGMSPFGSGGTSTAGKGGTSTSGMGGTSTGGTGGTSTAGTGGTPTSGSGAPVPGAGIIGVVSKSKATSIKIYNGRTRYDQWAVTYQDVKPGKGLPPDILQALNMSAAAAAAAGAAPGRAPAGNPFGGGAGQQPGGMNPFGARRRAEPVRQPWRPEPVRHARWSESVWRWWLRRNPSPPPQPGRWGTANQPRLSAAARVRRRRLTFGPPPKKS